MALLIKVRGACSEDVGFSPLFFCFVFFTVTWLEVAVTDKKKC